MKNIKLLLITNLFPNPAEPNRGIFVADMVKEMRNTVDVTVISPIPLFPRWKALKRFERWYRFSLIPADYMIDGHEVVCPKYIAIPKMGFLHSFFLFVALLPTVMRLHKSKRFDLINAHWLFPDGIAACWIAKILHIPIVLSAHGCDINFYLDMPLRRKQIMNALKRADLITVVSGKQKEKLCKAGFADSKITVINNGFGSDFTIQDRTDRRKELNLDVRQKIIIFVGRLVEVKGFDRLIKAIKQLESSLQDDFELAVVGDGPLRQRYEDEVSRYGLSHRIKFYGEKDHSQIYKWFGASDLMCLPSLSEGCPTVVLEALACGKPVVAARVGEIPELVNEKNGILVNAGDISELSASLSAALKKGWKEDEIRRSVSELSWKAAAEKYRDVFQKVIARRSGTV